MTAQQLPLDSRLMEWLIYGEWEFADPRKVLAGIEPADACRQVAGLPYTIAQLVAHTDWWQRRRIGIARGEEWQEFELQVDDWPQVTPEDWNRLSESFLTSYTELLALIGDGVDMGRTVFQESTVGSMLVSHTLHNAYHLGQIVLLRRLLGIWPPPGGGYAEQ